MKKPVGKVIMLSTTGEVINSQKKIEPFKEEEIRKDHPFVFLDPPYYPVAKGKNGKISPFKLYNGHDFLPVDFLKLKLKCDELTLNKVPFVLCNSDCEFIRVLFKDYMIADILEARSITGEKRPGVNCLIITNFKKKGQFMAAINAANDLLKRAKK